MISIRRLARTDIVAHAACPVSKEIVQAYGGDISRLPPPSLERSQALFDPLLQEPESWAICENEAPVGHLRLHSPRDRSARLAIGLWRQDRLSQGIGRAAIRLILTRAFGELGLHRVDLLVLASNPRAIRCYEACGFTLEGRLRQTLFRDGVWEDDLLYAILAPEFSA